MSNSTQSPIRCEAWESDNFSEDDNSSLANFEFLIEIFVHFKENAADSFEDLATPKASYKKFHIPREHLVLDGTSWYTISIMLNRVNVVPEDQLLLIQEIIKNARMIASEAHNVNRKTIPIIVYISGVKSSGELMIESQDLSEYIDDDISNIDSLHGSLRNVEVKGCDKNCVICLDELVIGNQAACMPCLHVFHEDCILNWLEKSNACPLCRFQVPNIGVELYLKL